MSNMSNIGFITSDAFKLQSVNKDIKDSVFEKFKKQLSEMPSVLDQDYLTKLRNGEYEISLKQYTNMNTYNLMMNNLYGNNSANKFQNTLNILTNSAEDKLATAKSFVEKMKENGMSNQTAVKTFSALNKYSLLSSSFGNYNYVNAKV